MADLKRVAQEEVEKVLEEDDTPIETFMPMSWDDFIKWKIRKSSSRTIDFSVEPALFMKKSSPFFVFLAYLSNNEGIRFITFMNLEFLYNSIVTREGRKKVLKGFFRD